MEIILHVVKEIGGKKSVTALLYMSNYVRTMPLNYNYVGKNICLWAIIMWEKTYAFGLAIIMCSNQDQCIVLTLLIDPEKAIEFLTKQKEKVYTYIIIIHCIKSLNNLVFMSRCFIYVTLHGLHSPGGGRARELVLIVNSTVVKKCLFVR